MTKARRVAAALAVAAAVTAIIGSALPLFWVSFQMGPGPVEFTMTAWGMETDGDIFPLGKVPANGYPLVFGAVLLAFAAGASRAAARPGTHPRNERVAGLAFVAGAAFLACAVWMVVAQAANWEDTYGPPDDTEEFSFDGETGYGAGVWILLIAALLGVAAAVLAQWSGKQPAPVAVAVDPDAPTPPFGIAMPVAAEEPAPPPLPSPPSPSLEPELPSLGPIMIPEPPPPPAPAGPAVPLVEDPLDEPRRD
jgi:hypothetical protein